MNLAVATPRRARKPNSQGSKPMTSAQSNRRWRTPCRAGATILEMAVVLGLVLVLLAMVILLLPGFGRTRDGARHIKDASQVRVILQGMQMAAANNQNLIPYPSTLHSGPPSEPDTPAALLRRLLADGLFSSEWLVSPAEANSAIRVFERDEAGKHNSPSRGPIEMFTATPSDIPGRTFGHCSYAFTPPFGSRRAWLKTDGSATQAVVGNRGPSFEGGRTEPWTLFGEAQERATGRKGITSKTLLIHGGRRTWEGNVAYADGHVNFESQADPPQLLWTFSGLPSEKQTRPDNLFVNENDQTGAADDEQLRGNAAANANNFLRLWSSASFDGAAAAGITPWYD
ncbi:MAG: hypothetical protein NTV94_16845 [Planctomycetota bacterium]|nr:hypothetical protein [Planctomycetota bacterium]